MSGQAAVVQVVVLRDGLLIGTQVFTPGQYSVGSAAGCDVHLDDDLIEEVQAHVFFQNGRVAIKDNGSGAVFVNGHLVNACEVRPVDEISCGPFTLKVRVMSQKPAAASAPPADVAAILGAAPQIPAIPSVRPVAAPAPAQATVVSSRRQASAVPAQAASGPAHPAPIDEGEQRTETVPLYDALFAGTDPLGAAGAGTTSPGARERKRSEARARQTQPTIPSAEGGQGRPHLFVDLYWGDTRRGARSFKRIDPVKKLVAREDDAAALPLWGFGLDGKGFVFAEQQGDLFRVYVPPGAAVERLAKDGNFYPVHPDTLEVGPGKRPCVTLGTGHALRLTGGDHALALAYVQPAQPRPSVNPLRDLPWVALAALALLSAALGVFVQVFGNQPPPADFTAKNVSPVAVKLLAPPKPEEKKKLEKLEKQIEQAKKKPEPALPRAVERSKAVPQETKKALKSLEKLTAAGPAMKQLLAAVDKLGSGPGAKNAKTDFKLSGLIGKAPIASAGLGSFGLGGGGAGGAGMKGAELLRGQGGAGVGALGTGRVGKGAVAGTVTHAVSRNVGAQGSIDKDAVARVINAHLHEVSSCYERALLKTPGLAGKIVLEWQITTAGGVGAAKTKSSTMQSPAVEACILEALKGWRFPPATGAGVIITYPFMFNSVGF